MKFLIYKIIKCIDLSTKYKEDKSTQIGMTTFNDNKQLEFDLKFEKKEDKFGSLIFNYGEKYSSDAIELSLNRKSEVFLEIEDLNFYFDSVSRYQDFLNRPEIEGKEFKDINFDD